MNDELKVALADFIKRLIDVANSGVDRLPAVLNNIVGAAILSATVWWWVGLASLLLGLLFIVFSPFIGAVEGIGLGFAGFLLFIPGAFTVGIQQYNYLYATRFPRLVILDYLSRLL